MSTIWLIGVLLGGAVYTIFILRAIFGMLKLDQERLLALPVPSTGLPSISVIIAARNEEDWIEGTLESLLAQDFPGKAKAYEIIVVDDRSTDRTAEIVQKQTVLHSNVHLIRQKFVPAGVSPKKAALARGIEESTGEIILITDADCRHHPGWAGKLAQFVLSRNGMAVGQARFISRKHDPLWSRLQALDFAAQGVLSAGLVAAKTPFNCSGASLGFTREAFRKVRGWDGIENFISGDDELLMRKFHAANIPVVAAWGSEIVVQTRSPESPTEFWRQRIRWGSKTLHYPLEQKVILSGVFLFYLSLAATPIIFFAGPYWLPGFAGMALKMLLDLSLLYASKALFTDHISKFEFILAELLHPPVIVILAIMGAFGSFDWKGSTYQTKAPE